MRLREPGVSLNAELATGGVIPHKRVNCSRKLLAGSNGSTWSDIRRVKVVRTVVAEGKPGWSSFSKERGGTKGKERLQVRKRSDTAPGGNQKDRLKEREDRGPILGGRRDNWGRVMMKEWRNGSWESDGKRVEVWSSRRGSLTGAAQQKDETGRRRVRSMPGEFGVAHGPPARCWTRKPSHPFPAPSLDVRPRLPAAAAK